MTKLLRDPLVHFLLAGALLFLLYGVVGSGSVEDDESVIVVDRDALLTFIQYRTKAFQPAVAAARLDALSDQELDRLVEEYVREEVLHREALALGLDRQDYIIRRRLVQKLEFITEGFTAGAVQTDEAALQRFFDTHADDYYVEPYVTFTHVFFETGTRPRESAHELAENKLAELNRKRVSFSAAPEHGERFPYHRNYVERTSEFVASHFGQEMSEAVFALPPDTSTWAGPFDSPYGVHLVMVTAHEDGRTPALEEVRGRVVEDARAATIRSQTQEAIESIVEEYDVRIDNALREELAPTPVDETGRE
ncbi:MAG: peptidyl-prolyl cis-trans isomerase [Myxococcota bacterium]